MSGGLVISKTWSSKKYKFGVKAERKNSYEQNYKDLVLTAARERLLIVGYIQIHQDSKQTKTE